MSNEINERRILRRRTVLPTKISHDDAVSKNLEPKDSPFLSFHLISRSENEASRSANEETEKQRLQERTKTPTNIQRRKPSLVLQKSQVNDSS
jgi:hypothetical protein